VTVVAREPKLSAHARGYTKRWQRESKAFLALRLWCIDCLAEGIYAERATVVDHEIPHRGDQRLFWDKTNWRPRCKPHHDRKTRSGR
jgi:5-methylcytosine-specific restriction protein A